MKARKQTPSIGSRIVERLRGFAEALEKGEGLTKRFTCRKVVMDLTPTSYNPELVKATRSLLGASQAVFARFLGVSVQTVRAWEQGVNAPNGMACRFMDEIRANPEYWMERLQKAVSLKCV
jgi:putative transcriptional regulator